MTNQIKYATEDKWPVVADLLAREAERGNPVGLDTEFYDADPEEESVYGKGRVHIWSMAVLTKRLNPRGFREAVGFVLPGAALHHGGIARWLGEPTLVKCVHNLPVDAHALANHGVTLRGAVNTLGMARWYCPEFARNSGGPGYSLKSLMGTILGRDSLGSFESVFRTERSERRTVRRRLDGCACGTDGCARKGKGHRRTEDVEVDVTVYDPVPLTTVTPGHPLWDTALRYSALDAVAAVELYDYFERCPDLRPTPFVWPSGGPGSSLDGPH